MGKGNKIEILKELRFPHSLGSVYAAVTQFLGFKANSGEGKVMGLAPYGRPTFVDDFRRILTVDDDGLGVAELAVLFSGLDHWRTRGLALTT